MIGEERQLNQLSLQNNRWKFNASGGLLITLEEFMKYTSNIIEKTKGVNMQTLRSQPIKPKNLPDHWGELTANYR